MTRDGVWSRDDPGVTTAVWTPPWTGSGALRARRGPGIRHLGLGREGKRQTQPAWPAPRVDDEASTLEEPRAEKKPRSSGDARWWLRNCDTVVGPVTSTRLLLGIVNGRVPQECEVRAARDLSWRPLASTPPFDDALRNRQRSSAPGPLRTPELTGAPSAFGLPAEGSWLDDDYDRHALVPAEPGSARADSNDLPALIPLDVRVAPPKRRRSTVRRVLGTLLLGCAFTLGGWVAYSGQGLELPRTPRALARVVSGPHRPKVTATAHRRVAPPSLERHGEREPVPLLENRPPDPGTLDDTRQRKDPHQEQLAAFSREVEGKPAQLSRRATQKKLFEFVENPSTTVGALTLLAQVATPKSLDILYQVWTGSKGRTDATRLAQTLLLGEEVRSHAAPALEVALALRERPTDCGQVRRLVDAALAHGDQRSAMLLVRTAERKDCKEGRLTTQCAMCLGNPNKIRTAIRVTARRR